MAKKRIKKPVSDVVLRKWDDSYLLDIYDHTREGLALSQIAEAMGIDKRTLKFWYNEKQSVRDAVARGRSRGLSKNAGETFIEYVYKRLPQDLQEKWDELSEFEDDPNFQKRAEALFAAGGMHVRQHLFVHALVCSNFNASEACRKVNISRMTFEKWVATDPKFSELIDEVQWHRKNFTEGALMNLVSQGETSAVIFANRTVNRDRGYEPKTNVQVDVNTLNMNMDLDKLDLPIEARRQVVQAIRQKQGKIIDVTPAPQQQALDYTGDLDE